MESSFAAEWTESWPTCDLCGLDDGRLRRVDRNLTDEEGWIVDMDGIVCEGCYERPARLKTCQEEWDDMVSKWNEGHPAPSPGGWDQGPGASGPGAAAGLGTSLDEVDAWARSASSRACGACMRCTP